MNTDVTKLIERMKECEVSFIYRKKDGTERSAIGTICPAIINRLHEKNNMEIPKKSEKSISYNENQIRYFDSDKLGWRSFTKDQLIGWSIDEEDNDKF